MAGRTVVGARNVSRRLRRCVELGACNVTGAAVPGRSLEDRVQMTGFTGEIAVDPVELKSRRKMIEGYRDRRRARVRTPRGYEQEQHHHA